ncbi:MAG: hypothetical protein Q8L07_04490 [Sediminibacterium sp.]|nr:hypothetical protein [Sediminibacterium sp.]MDP1810972.1 hypothetical protein [Sediminibacterium sp.]MDP3128168.1 hypothetical protein [Sediminibacterium sp.]MDP3666916.1 hypothetical protein [Sediminibacterium sp.]
MNLLFPNYLLSRVVAFLATTLAMSFLTNTLLGCGQQKKNGFSETELIVHYSITLLHGDSIRHNVFIDTVKILYYKEFTIYTLPPKRRMEDNSYIQGTNSYFFYKKNSPKGVWLTNLDSFTNFTHHPVDSFLEKRAFKSMKFSIPPTDTLISKDETSKTYLEKWIPKRLINENQYDTLCYYYSKNTDSINFKLSKNLDSISRYHLYKVRIIFNERFSSSYLRMLPSREYYFETKHTYITKTDTRISKINTIIQSNIVK